MMNPMVFISHSSNDKQAAIQLASEFRARELDVWIDHERIKYGESIPQAIEEGLKQSACIVVIISSSFSKSKWCRTEYEPLLVKEIEQSKVFVVPILIEDCEVPLLLSQKLYVDLRNLNNVSLQLDELTRQIKGYFKKDVIYEEAQGKLLAHEITEAKNLTREDLLLISLRDRLRKDFFTSGHRKGEFGKTRIPNENQNYHGPVREVLRHKPHYYMTCWGWQVMPELLPNLVNERKNMTVDAIKRQFNGRRWIEVDLESYDTGPTGYFKRGRTIRHTVKSAEILLLFDDPVIPSQVAWDLINESSSLINNDGGWKELIPEEPISPLWASVNVFRFLSVLRTGLCDARVPGEFESFLKLSAPVVETTEKYLASNWDKEGWKYHKVPSKVNAPLVLIDYVCFATNYTLVENVYSAVRDLISPAGRLVDPNLGEANGAPEYVFSIRLAYALSLTNSIKKHTDSRSHKLTDWVLDNYSDEYVLDTCDIAFLYKLIKFRQGSSLQD